MSIWDEYSVEERVLEALGEVKIINPDGHHFGRPWLTAYQVAIMVNDREPRLAPALGVEIGGMGVGQRTSLAQYLARELSRKIKAAGESYPVEGAFLSNERISTISYRGPAASSIVSSVTGSGYDLSLFRLRGIGAA